MARGAVPSGPAQLPVPTEMRTAHRSPSCPRCWDATSRPDPPADITVTTGDLPRLRRFECFVRFFRNQRTSSEQPLRVTVVLGSLSRNGREPRPGTAAGVDVVAPVAVA